MQTSLVIVLIRLVMRYSHPLLLAILALLVLSACSSTRSKIKENLAFLGVNYHDYSHITDSYFRGQLYFDGDQAYFKSCEGNFEYEVIENDDLNDIYENITDSEDSEAPVYIEFMGEIIFHDHGGDDSQVEIGVEAIHHMSVAKVSLQCAKATDTFDFKAKGESPYWRINVHQNELFFATKAGNQSYQINGFTLDKTDINYFEGINQEGEHLFLEILPKQCYMQNKKEYWSYSTKVSTIYGEFWGCGESGQQTNITLFKGEYENQEQGIHLTLNKDNSVIYQQMKDQSQTLKTGFWKSNNAQQVVIMLTTENSKMIQEELVFTRNQSTLTSVEMNKDNAVTEFEKPLSFTKTTSNKAIHDDQGVHITRQFLPQALTPDAEVDQQVQLALRQYFSIHRTDPKKTQFNSVRFDLNNDGYEEAIVLLDWCSGVQCELLIFQGSSTGFQFSSRISLVEAPITVSQHLHFSWQSLLIQTPKGWAQLNFDGQSYPLHSRDAEAVENNDNATPVHLFSNGKPTHWHYIKQQ